MNHYIKIKEWLGHQLSRGIGMQLLIFFIFAVIGLGIATALSGGNVRHGFADMVNGANMKRALYSDTEPGNAEGQNTISLLIIYFIGTIVFSGLMIATITNVIKTYGDRYREGTNRLPWRKHTLFLGYDTLMAGTLKAAVSEARHNNKVVVVAVDSGVPDVRNEIYSHFSKKESKGHLYVIKASRNNEDGLRKARVYKANKVFIIGNSNESTHDAINLRALGLIAGICTSEGHLPKTYIYIRNRATMSLFGQQGLHYADLLNDAKSACKKEDEPKLLTTLRDFVDNNLTPFNFYKSIASNLLCSINLPTMKLDWHSKQDNLCVNPGRKLNLVIAGMSDMAVTLALETLRLVHYPKQTSPELKITFIDENASKEMHIFIGRIKEFFRFCPYSYIDVEKGGDAVEVAAENPMLDVSFEFIQGIFTQTKVTSILEQRALDQTTMLTIAICTDNSPKNMAMALCLPRTLLDKGADIPVWVYQDSEGSLHSFMQHYMYSNLHIFSPDIYGNVDVIDSEEYEWARWLNAVHSAYYSGNGGHNPSNAEILSSWKGQSLNNCLSSINNVRSFTIKLRSIGWILQSDGDNIILSSAIVGESVSQLDISEHFPELANAEHTRWNIEKLLSGYRPTDPWDHEVIMRELDDCRTRGLNETHRKVYEERRANFEHDDIRPYAELREYIRNKDINMLKAMESMINQVIKKRNT